MTRAKRMQSGAMRLVVMVGAVLTAFVGAAPLALAERIDLAIAGGASVDETGVVRFYVQVANVGRTHAHAAAHEVSVAVSMAGAVTEARLIDRLATNAIATGRMQLELDAPAAGRDVAIARVMYRDANGYPFETLAALPVTLSDVYEPGTDTLAVSVERTRLRDTAHVHIGLHHGETSSVPVTVALYLPSGLSPPVSRTNIVLTAGKASNVAFPIERTFLTRGSSADGIVVVQRSRADGAITALSWRAPVRVLPFGVWY